MKLVSTVRMKALQVIMWTISEAEIILIYWMLELVLHKTIWMTSNQREQRRFLENLALKIEALKLTKQVQILERKNKVK